MMQDGEFTFEEQNLLCIYLAESRQGVIDNLKEMQQHLEQDEQELLQLTEGAIQKLQDMSDEAFDALELIPDF